VARKRCWRRDWVVDLDIKGFFDNLDWGLVMRAVRFHTDLKWLHLYIERWLRAPVKLEDGSLVERTKGTPQGSVISPLLANLFMHYAFDAWMGRNHPNIQFERYVDDVVIHCVSEKQAMFVLGAVRCRLKECGLELHPEKTQIVYCKDDDRKGKYQRIKFDFLGYTFQPRRAKNRYGKFFISFLPAISTKSANKIRATIRGWRIAARRNNQSLEDIAELSDPYVRGWMNYYGRFYRSKCHQVLRYLNDVLVKWVRRKYKDRFRRKERKAAHWLGRIAQRAPNLFVLWRLGIKPAAGR
jgi:RNA-directed DNA polymerase